MFIRMYSRTCKCNTAVGATNQPTTIGVLLATFVVAMTSSTAVFCFRRSVPNAKKNYDDMISRSSPSTLLTYFKSRGRRERRTSLPLPNPPRNFFFFFLRQSIPHVLNVSQQRINRPLSLVNNQVGYGCLPHDVASSERAHGTWYLVSISCHERYVSQEENKLNKLLYPPTDPPQAILKYSPVFTTALSIQQ